MGVRQLEYSSPVYFRYFNLALIDMNRGMFLFLLVLLSSAWTLALWEEFVSHEGKFKLLTPGELTPKVNAIETAIGQLKYHTFIHQPEDKQADNLVYMISYCDYPDHTVSSDSLDLVGEFFQTTIEGAVESVNGALRYATEIQYGQYPGRLWRIDYSEGAVIVKTKAYLVGQRYYAIQTITLKGRSLNKSSDRFLDSFHLID
ncbi:MAG: hypothetical protein AAF985_14870 [Bacteroidota bacterium]